MTSIAVPGDAARGVHDLLGGRPNALAGLLAESRRALADGPVQWRVAVTPETVHRIESLHRLGEENRFEVLFTAAPELDDSERAFFDDYTAHRLTDDRWARGRRKLAELVAASGEAVAALRRACTPVLRDRPVPAALRTVVLIGAYGGDHVGDAAILGGVLNTLHRRDGAASATIMSHRPDHTRRLVAGLSTPLSIAVEPYTAARVDRLLDGADALVLAGGPLSHMPRVLAKHLAAVHAARIRGLPLLVERVGIGEFRHAASAWAARQVLKRAASISVRFADSARHRLVEGLAVTVGRDPAFDYLATRGALDRLIERDRRSVDDLFADAGDALRIGINLRPVLDRWHERGSTHSQRLQDRFIDDLANGLVEFAKRAPRRVKFFAFPMNAIQFGLSDLTAAYRLHRALGSRADLHVWEADPQVDGVLYFLRSLDAAVVMRLHAAIFGLTQNLPVVGIDYFSGMDRKLTQLLQDLGHAADVTSMDAFESSWMVSRLRDKLALDRPARDAVARSAEGTRA